MKHFSIAVLSFALIFAACGGDSSSTSANESGVETDSSSSVASDDSKKSSDSKSGDKVASSSSVKKDDKSVSSSSEKKPRCRIWGIHGCPRWPGVQDDYAWNPDLDGGKLEL